MKRILLLSLGILIMLGCSTDPAQKVKEIINVPEGFEPVYKVKEVKNLNYVQLKRLAVQVYVPVGLSKEQLENNLKHAAQKFFLSRKPCVIAVNALKEGFTSGTYHARCIFAPEGKWEKASREINLDTYKVSIVIEKSYFQKSTDLKVGSFVILKSNDSKTVELSRDPGGWRDEDITHRLPNGTRVKVVGFQSFSLGKEDMIRFRIETQIKNKTVSGWVHKWDVKAVGK
ncbi:MAG: hypothetical protein KAW12_07005 [Candidatus Aminicenantes bacterium]|nr:hypothetical protein [Candidatus Aminicenantes bacterium]